MFVASDNSKNAFCFVVPKQEVAFTIVVVVAVVKMKDSLDSRYGGWPSFS